MKPGVFLADVQISSPEVTLGAGESQAMLKSLMARVTGGREQGVVGFSIRAEDFGAGGPPRAAGTPAMLFEGGIYNLSDAKGNLTSDVAQVSMKGDAFNAPTPILDAMAHQGGMLAEALGPTVTLNVRTEGVSEQKGKLIVKAISPRAEAEIKGTVVGGVFRTEGEPTITLKSVSPELGRMLVQGMPFIGTFEKLPEDGPAIIKARALSIPIDGQVQRLNGDVTIDFGTAHFETGKVFGALLKIAGQKDRGTLGRRLDPLTLTIRNGVIDYPRWKVPVGEFNLDARGTVDLVNRRMDLVTYIPFGALTDEAAGKLNTGLGRLISGAVPLLEQATMIPFHTTGSFDDPKTEPDLQLYVKEAGRTLLRPDRLIKEGIQDIFKRDKKDEKK